MRYYRAYDATVGYYQRAGYEDNSTPDMHTFKAAFSSGDAYALTKPISLPRVMSYREFKLKRPRTYAPPQRIPSLKVFARNVSYFKKIRGSTIISDLPLYTDTFQFDLNDVKSLREKYRVQFPGEKLRIIIYRRSLADGSISKLKQYALIYRCSRRVKVKAVRLKVRVKMRTLKFRLSYSFYRRLYKMERLQQVNARRLVRFLLKKQHHVVHRNGDYLYCSLKNVPKVITVKLRSKLPSSSLESEPDDDYLWWTYHKVDLDFTETTREVETFPYIVPYAIFTSDTLKLVGKRGSVTGPVWSRPYPSQLQDQSSRPIIQSDVAPDILAGLCNRNLELFRHVNYTSNPHVSGWGRYINKLNSKAANASVNLGVTLGEFNESVSMLSLSVSKFASALRSARGGNFYQAAVTLTGKGTLNGKLASNWLELQYGWLPLMSEISGYYDFLVKGSLRTQKLKASSTFSLKSSNFKLDNFENKEDSAQDWVVPQTVVSYDGDAALGLTVKERCANINADYLAQLRSTYPEGSTKTWYDEDLSSSLVGILEKPCSAVSDITFNYLEVKTHVNVSCVLDSPFDNIDRLGLGDVYSIAWELVPFSFVVDWFLPVGDLLQVLTSSKRILSKVTSLNLTVSHQLYIKGIQTGINNHPDSEIFSKSSARSTVSIDDVKDNLSVPFDPSFSYTKALNALALLKQVILK